MERIVGLHLSGATLNVQYQSLTVMVSTSLIPSYVRTSPSGIIKTVVFTSRVVRGMGRDALDREWNVTGQLT